MSITLPRGYFSLPCPLYWTKKTCKGYKVHSWTYELRYQLIRFQIQIYMFTMTSLIRNEISHMNWPNPISNLTCRLSTFGILIFLDLISANPIPNPNMYVHHHTTLSLLQSLLTQYNFKSIKRTYNFLYFYRTQVRS